MTERKVAEAIWDMIHATLHEQKSCFNPDHESPKRTFRQMPGAPLGVIARGTHGWIAAPDDAELLDAELAGGEKP